MCWSDLAWPVVRLCLADCDVIQGSLLYLLLLAGLTPNTTYRVSIRAKNIKASPYVDEKSLIRLLEKLSAHTEFRTLKKGLPDPPMDVRVDPGPQDGTVLVTWIPVTLNNQVKHSHHSDSGRLGGGL